MDTVIEPSEIRRRRGKRGVTAAVAVAALIFLFAASVNYLRPSVSRSQIQTARVSLGSVDAAIEASGSVIPAFEKVLSSPVDARVLQIRRHPGDRVQPGDELLGLDTSASRLDLARLDERVSQKGSEQQQLRLKLDQELVTLQSQYEQKKLDAQMLGYRADQTATLRREGLASEQDKRVADVAAQKATIEVEQLRKLIESTRRSAAAQLAAAQGDWQMLVRERDESRRQLDLAMMRADRNGVVTWIVQEEGATIRKGDVVARIADLSAFRVLATISDIHVSRLAAGMRARVKADATDLMGTITSIDPRIDNGSAKFYVDLDLKSHPALRNNLRVDVYPLRGRREKTLQLRRGTLAQAEREEVWVIRGNRAVKVPVRFGLVSPDNAEVLSGLKEGDVVITNSMTDFENVKELRVKP
jgi:HlyD family secretion protein